MRNRNTRHTLASLFDNTETVGDCWLWRGPLRATGYGVVYLDGKHRSVHAAALHLADPEMFSFQRGFEVDHICNNRACINPAHLRVVTHRENMRAGVIRRTTCRAGHPWTNENTYVAKVKYKGGYREQRYCRTCRARAAQDLRDREELKFINSKGPR